MKKRSHIVQRQTIEVSFPGLDDGVGTQDRLAEIFYTRIQPKMNLLFDEIANDRYVLSLDKLEIDCGVLSAKHWEDEFVEATLRRLKAELLTKHKKVLPVGSEIGKQAEEAFLFFLEHGHLPWNKPGDSLKELEVLIQINPLFIEKLRTTVAGNKTPMKRFINSTSETFKEKILAEFKKEKNAEWKWIQSSDEENGLTNKNISMEALMIFLSNKAGSADIIKMKTKNVHFSKGLKKEAEKPVKEKKAMDENESDETYINNAGVVLLHPFLPKLFEIGGLCKENDWIDQSSQHAGVKVLEYLCTGKNEFEEIHFTLHKILCGLKPSDFVDEKQFLSEEIIHACDIMLGEVIGYWPQLKNTGIEAFRETFLQRNGKLTVTDNGWLLQVEQKAVDVLLDSLQWGIGIVKMPWMQDIVYTEWR